VAAIVLGAVQAWTFRDHPSSIDTISYLDIGDAYVHGHWKQALNGYFSPLYSWLLGLVLAVVRPSERLEYPTVTFVDYAIFLVALAGFRWFLKNLRIGYRASIARQPATSVAIPDWAWIVGGYTLFLWSSIRWIRLSSSSPDMCGAAISFGVWGLLLRLGCREGRASYALLGALLGLGYFARTAFLPVGFSILLIIAVERVASRRRGAILAGLVLVALSAPFIISLSITHRRFTVGDSGKLVHIWLGNPGGGLIGALWQGGPAGYGSPRHPTRVIWNDPSIFEFAKPIIGTYPPWTDPSYWYEGLTYRFDAAREWTVFKDSLIYYYRMFGRWLLLTVAVALVSVGALKPTLRAMASNSGLWVPAVFGLALYAGSQDLLIIRALPPQPHSRYMAAFVTILALILAFSFRFRSVRPTKAAAWGLRLGLGALSLAALVALAAEGIRDLGVDRSPSPWEVARGLKQAGISFGMPIAIVGYESRHEYWARLARARIIAQVPDDSAFWRQPSDFQPVLLHALARTGARAVVSWGSRRDARRDGWVDIPDTNYAMRDLSPFR
jgi:hypothetical protein